MKFVRKISLDASDSVTVSDEAVFGPILQRTRGFLSDVHMCGADRSGAILLLSRFHVGHFTSALFEALDLNNPEVLQKAVTKRRAEFLAGRVMAKLALRALGSFETDIPIGPDRAPVWPSGSAGSISHTRDRCACLALPDAAFHPGVDIEALAFGQAMEAILKTVVNAQERAIIETQTSLSSALFATLAFSAKETLFKALYPIVRRFFGFDSAEFFAPPSEGRLGLRLTKSLHPSLPAGQTYDVRFIATAHHVLTWLVVPRP